LYLYPVRKDGEPHGDAHSSPLLAAKNLQQCNHLLFFFLSRADNIQYAKTVKLMATREKAAGLDFSEFLEEEVEAALKEAGAWGYRIRVGHQIP
jgi:hypothetical protein